MSFTRFDQSSPVQPNPEKENLEKSGKIQKITFVLKNFKIFFLPEKKYKPFSFPIQGGRDSTSALESILFQNLRRVPCA